MKKLYLFFFATSLSLLAKSQSLDKTFGNNGIIILSGNNQNTFLFNLLVQKDGKIVITGSESPDNVTFQSFLLRFNKNGSIDSSYGQNGKSLNVGLYSAMQYDDKIIELNSVDAPQVNGQQLSLTRYDTNSNIDSSYGINGTTIIDFFNKIQAPGPTTIQRDNKAVVAGQIFSSYTNVDLLLARFNANGSPDNTFGDGGATVTDFGFGDFATVRPAINSDGRILVSGEGQDSLGRIFGILGLYKSNGSLDSSFGQNGKLILGNGLNFLIAACSFQNGQKIILNYETTTDNISYHDYLSRYNLNGSLDSSFGNNGVIEVTGEHMIVQADQKILIAGNSRVDPNNTNFFLSRYNPDGTPDQSFGTNGAISVNLISGSTSFIDIDTSANQLFVSGWGQVSSTITNGLLAKFLLDNTNNQNISVKITSPVNGSSYNAGNTIILQAQATDSNGHITKVQFYNAGSKFAEDSTAPYKIVIPNAEAGNYLLTAKAFDNNGDSAVSDTVRVTVTACKGSGHISGEGYINIPGTQLINLASSYKYPNHPDVIASLNTFEYGPNLGDNYGARVRGYICAPLTGNYTFYIASDDQSELWLSTDDSPLHIRKIAYVATRTNFRAWFTFPSQKSFPIRLVKGVRYYIETVHKEGTGADHLSVGWVLPDGSKEAPIPGSRLSPWQDHLTPAPDTAINFNDAMRAIEKQNDKFIVLITPNPSRTYFSLRVKSNSDALITLTVVDVLGRVVEKIVQSPDNVIEFGRHLCPGLYFAEVRQGINIERVKLIKQ